MDDIKPLDYYFDKEAQEDFYMAFDYRDFSAGVTLEQANKLLDEVEDRLWYRQIEPTYRAWLRRLFGGQLILADIDDNPVVADTEGLLWVLEFLSASSWINRKPYTRPAKELTPY